MPSAEQLQAIRQEIYYHPGSYLELLNGEPFRSFFDQHYYDSLKTAPKGYPKEWEHIELIKNRSYGFGHNLSEKEVLADDFPKKVVEYFKIVKPMNHFLNRAVDENFGV